MFFVLIDLTQLPVKRAIVLACIILMVFKIRGKPEVAQGKKKNPKNLGGYDRWFMGNP
jgi:hypothetical protein